MGDRGADRCLPGGDRRRDGVPARDRAPVRDTRVGDREHAARRRGEGLELEPGLEITTCLRRGEIEIATRFEPDAQAAYDRLLAFIRERHADTLFSLDGSTIDDQVAELLDGHRLATAESCTGGLLASRLTDRAGASAYFLGGAVVYSNQAKIDLAGVDPELIERFGAVSAEVAEALADGGGCPLSGRSGGGDHRYRRTWGRDRGQARRAGVHLGVERWRPRRGRAPAHPATVLPGTRADIRDRSVTVSMHMLRRLLLGEADEARLQTGGGEAPTRPA